MSLPDDLRVLLADLSAELDPTALPAPPYRQPEGMAQTEWLAAVAAARAAHDAFAVRRAELAEARAGRTVAALLGIGDGADFVRHRRELDVPTGIQLGDLSPALSDAAPTGPPPAAVSPTARVALTVTQAADAGERRPAILRLHGGAFWMGGGGTSQRLDRTLVTLLVARAGATVVDVDYRLAPEHPFPACIVDPLLALDAVRADADALGIDPTRIALLGTSSGGAAAVGAARADAIRGAAPPLAALGLIVPSVDLTAASSPLRGDPEAWAARLGQLTAYLGDPVPLDDPWVSPALLDAIPGMPPTFAVVAEHDEIAQGAAGLCAAIRAGGGRATHRAFPMTHTVATPEVEAEYLAQMADFLAALLRS